MDREKLKVVALSLAKEYANDQLKSGYLPAGLHPYYDEDGKLIYFKIRLKHPDGKKWIRPFHFNQIKNKYLMEEPKFPNKKKPLYNLSELKKRPHEPVLIHEGELCCEKSSALGMLSVTSGGATSAKQTDWLPLAGRSCYLWPDNNTEGFKYAEEIKQILKELKCDIKVIDIKTLNIPEKGDIVDWLKANPNATYDDLLSLPMIQDLTSNNQIKENVNDYEKVINELAKLREIDFQFQRKEIAKNLKISVTALDKLVKQARSQINASTNEIFANIEPWHEYVDGKTLLDELENLINRFMVFPSVHEAKAIVLHIIHTHCLDAASCSPILNISSPEKRCGKSTLLSVLQQLANRPLIASSISSAAVFRSIEKWKPTLILDESDTFLPDNDEIRGVINSGHTRESAYVIRCTGDDHEPNRFSTWCPKIIAGIGHLPETVEDRSIIIQLRRKLGNEKKDKLRNVSKTVFNELLQKCIRFAADNIENLKNINPIIPEILNDRSADNWTPLIAIAQLAGEAWLIAATTAAIHLSDSKQELISMGTELLHDIKNIFDTKRIDRIYTGELLDILYSETEAPWATYNRGKPLSARQLANRLREYKIHSKDMRISPLNKNLKGYSFEDFSEAFSRYIPSSTPNEVATSATARQSNIDEGSADFSKRDKNNVSRVESILQPMLDANCSVVADKYPDFNDRSEKEKMGRVEL